MPLVYFFLVTTPCLLFTYSASLLTGKVNSVRGSNRATTVFSTSKFPGPAKCHPIPSTFVDPDEVRMRIIMWVSVCEMIFIFLLFLSLSLSLSFSFSFSLFVSLTHIHSHFCSSFLLLFWSQMTILTIARHNQSFLLWATKLNPEICSTCTGH